MRISELEAFSYLIASHSAFSDNYFQRHRGRHRGRRETANAVRKVHAFEHKVQVLRAVSAWSQVCSHSQATREQALATPAGRHVDSGVGASTEKSSIVIWYAPLIRGAWCLVSIRAGDVRASCLPFLVSVFTFDLSFSNLFF